jgi:hypothetical protein
MINTKCGACIFHDSRSCDLNVPENMVSLYPSIYSENNFTIDSLNNLVIKNFCCPYARTKEWKTIVENQNLDIFDTIIQETKPKNHLVLLLINDTDKCIEKINRLISVDGEFISLVGKNLEKDTIDSIISVMNDSTYKNKWKISNVLDPETTICEMIDTAIENNFDINNSSLLTIMNCVFDIDFSFFNKTRNIIHYFLNQPAVIIPKNILDYHNMAIPISLFQHMHKKLGLVLDYIETTKDPIYKFTILNE